jgi:hypothetical protein
VREREGTKEVGGLGCGAMHRFGMSETPTSYLTSLALRPDDTAGLSATIAPKS